MSTKITTYNVNCGTDCNISLKENMDVSEVMTKIWDGTEKELQTIPGMENGPGIR